MPMFKVLTSAFAAVFLLSIPYHSEAFEIRYNCDLRELKLNELQKSQLRLFRQQYKQTRQNIVKDHKKRKNNNSMQLIFKRSTFDADLAQHIAISYQEEEIMTATEELRFYHNLFYILSPEQRSIWMKNCTTK